MSLIDFKIFISKQLKNGSVILALILPILLVLGQFDLIRRDYMILLNQILIGVEVFIIAFQIGFDMFLKSKIKLNKVNIEIQQQHFYEAKEVIKDNLINESVKFGVKTTKDIINTIKTKQNTETEIVPEHNIPDNLFNSDNISYLEETATRKPLFPPINKKIKSET